MNKYLAHHSNDSLHHLLPIKKFIKKKFVFWGRGGKDWESGISRGKLLHTGRLNSKVLLSITGRSIQYLVINHHGKEHEKEYVYA